MPNVVFKSQTPIRTLYSCGLPASLGFAAPQGPRLVKRCQARSIDHLHAPTACLHLVVKQNCAALRNAFVFSLASGCPVKRLLVSIKSLLGSLRPTYLMSSSTGNYHHGQLPSQLQLGTVVGENGNVARTFLLFSVALAQRDRKIIVQSYYFRTEWDVLFHCFDRPAFIP